MVTGSRELIREMNRRLVLETVINDGPLSRAAISKKLGLTKATISAIVQDLLEEQYIEEIGSDQTQYGRKPILLQFCRQNGYIIALDLGVERTVLMVCDLLGQNCRLHQYNCPLERDTSIDFLLQLIRNQIRLLPATPFGVVGIGMKSPSLQIITLQTFPSTIRWRTLWRFRYGWKMKQIFPPLPKKPLWKIIKI